MLKAILSGRIRPDRAERTRACVLFSDIRGFTKRGEGMQPENLVSMLNRYFTVMSEVVHKHHGTVDKFVGDAVMALWNAPTDDPDHVAHACEAMLACRIANRALDPEFAEAGWPAYHTRYGLHVGDADATKTHQILFELVDRARAEQF